MPSDIKQSSLSQVYPGSSCDEIIMYVYYMIRKLERDCYYKNFWLIEEKQYRTEGEIKGHQDSEVEERDHATILKFKREIP